MKANELRIGNLVYCWNPSYTVPPNTYDTVISINWKHIRNCVEQPNHGTYKPIPLTEEWLYNLGYLQSVDLISMIWTKDNVIIRAGKGFRIYRNLFQSIEIEHVHQFQNLHFALTGEELPT